MGYRFNLNHGNIVVYLTTPAAETPRIPREHLREFLLYLHDRAAYRWRDGGAILSRDPRWHERVDFEARRSLKMLDEIRSLGVLRPQEVAGILRPLRALLSQFRLFAMPVWRMRDPHEMDLLMERFALQEAGSLVLFPDFHGSGDIETAGLDALPAFDLALQQKKRWPGVLFWTDKGGAAFVTADNLHSALARIHAALISQDPNRLEREIWELGTESPSRGRRILHLSDLHFGSEHAHINAPFLAAELYEAVRIVDRIVITGDLFDTPRESNLAAYQRFAQELHRSSGKDPICIAGNHDSRLYGNRFGIAGFKATQLAALRWSSHVIDDDISTVFLGVDSSIGGSFARGKVGRAQMARVAAEHRNAMSVRPEIRDYLTVALVHHHPYSFETTPSTVYQRVLAAFGASDEQLMRLKDADEYVSWCARWGVSVILHGHKHKPRYEVRTIVPEGGVAHELPAVGCGSSLGAEGSPMSYVILTWKDEQKRWSATFYESRGGGPFVAQLITVTRQTQPSDKVTS